MKRSIVLFLHIGFWLCYLLLIIVILGVFYGNKENVSPSQITSTIETIVYFALVPSFISFYAYYHLIFRRYILNKKYVKAVLFSIAISIASGSIGFALLFLIKDQNCVDSSVNSSFVGINLFISFIATITGIVALVLQGFITWIDDIKVKEELSNKNNEIELALVKSQLDPHFLFNTINNIDVLIAKNATEASNYLNKLSEIMRFMLYDTKADKIFLSKELMYIEKYIELQKIRTSNASFVTFSVIGKADSLLIPPMIFIPFIESAFKHSTNKKVKNAIRISVIITPEIVTFICLNQFNPHAKINPENTGLGNKLIEKRLNLIYRGTHNLDVSNLTDVYSVTLTIPTYA